MKRCLICGNPECPGCNPFSGPPAPQDDSNPVSSTTAPQRPTEAVWVSARLGYFRAPADSLPSDIGILGFSVPDGLYRRLDGFLFAFLRARVERLDGAAKAEGRRLLRDIATEAINAGQFPASFDNPAEWPRISPAGYEFPTMEKSTDYFPLDLPDSSRGCKVS